MRNLFQQELDEQLDTLVAMADVTTEMLDGALRSLIEHDTDLAEQVRIRDAEVDRAYEDVQHGLLRIIATQAPVASDLRFISAMLHVAIHVERMGDYAASTAKMGQLAAELLDDPELAQQLRDMADIAREVGQAAIRSFVQRDVDTARSLAQRDDQVDKLNIGIFHRLVRLAAADERRLEWATHMILVARQIERWSDHAVDIGEQTIFAVTGSTVELSSNEPASYQERHA